MHRMTRRLLPALLFLAACSRGDARPAAPRDEAPRATAARERAVAALDRLDAALVRLEAAAPAAEPDSLRAAFIRARLAYKGAEHLVELYAPTTADAINGPPIDEVEEDDPNRFVLRAEGFQVVEELLWPEVDDAARADVAAETRILRSNARRARGMLAATPLTDAAVWDAARQQIARVVVLGLAGFDSPLAGRSIPEAAASLRALREAVAPYAGALQDADPALAGELDARFAGAIAMLDTAPPADAFDRLAFLTDGADPLARTLWRARARLDIAAPPDRRAWRGEAATLWQADAFDAGAFGPAGEGGATPERAALGRMLFFDPVLSGDGSRACASCHVPERGFADGRARPLPLRAGGPVPRRNTPTVVNAGLQAGTFYDLRTAFLEDQVAEVVRNRDEMHGDFARAAALVAGSPEYVAHVQRAYPSEGAEVTEARIRGAVAAYVRSLQGTSAPFDRYVRGERTALGPAERRGYNLFMGRARCGSCHFAPLFNGTVPPAFAKTEVEVLGVPDRPARGGVRVDADEGRGALQGIPLYRHAFKTPTVRNAAVTAPYMHNGVFATLEEVVDFYDRGGGPAWGIHLDNQTLPADSLGLSAVDRADLVAFMRALTDTTGLTARPARLPVLPGAPKLQRDVGGY
jgi:cytochrome c peroxidase